MGEREGGCNPSQFYWGDTRIPSLLSKGVENLFLSSRNFHDIMGRMMFTKAIH